MTPLQALASPAALGTLTALLLASIVHEIGHLLLAWGLGVPVRLVALGVGRPRWGRQWGNVRLEVRSLPVGMVVGTLGRWDGGRPRYSAKRAAAVAAGGPLAGLLLAAILLLLAAQPPLIAVQPWLHATANLSFLLTLLNLMPLPGLDGGHLLLRLIEAGGLRLSAHREATLHRQGLAMLGLLSVGSLGLLLVVG